MDKKTIFRRVLDAVVEGRTRQAQRFLADYLRTRRDEPPRQG